MITVKTGTLVGAGGVRASVTAKVRLFGAFVDIRAGDMVCQETETGVAVTC